MADVIVTDQAPCPVSEELPGRRSGAAFGKVVDDSVHILENVWGIRSHCQSKQLTHGTYNQQAVALRRAIAALLTELEFLLYYSAVSRQYSRLGNSH